MLGKALKYIRIFHNMNQTVFAERIGISRSYLSEIEAGKKPASIELLEKYSSLFNIPVSSLLLFSEELESPIFPEKGRLYVADKILKIMEWMVEKDNINDEDKDS